MADFTETIANQDLKRKLVNALERPKPFKNFKWHIDNSGKYREEWFKHKSLRYINWVKNQLDT